MHYFFYVPGLTEFASACLVILLLSTSVQARFSAPSDAASAIQFFNRIVDVKEDGTSEEIIELKVKILNDSGRSNLATEPLYYKEGTQKLKVMSAKAIDQGQEFPVSSEFIEDKPIASQINGFSSYRQVLISFPRLHTGTEIYLKYSLQQTIPYLAENFFTEFVYGRERYWISSKVKLTSSIPFSIATNDPECFLDIQSKSEGKRQVLEISLKKPIIKEVVNEQDVLLDNKALPWVSVSSVKDWKTLIEKITPIYERVLEQPLPQLFLEISKKAAQEADLHKKINRVTSILAHELHYMGDWRNGSWPGPHNFEFIAQARRGDCKDFSTVTAAILKNLGIKANIALVRRGEYYDDPNDIPSLGAFNHAIVRVETDNQVLWVDPTNFESFAHGLFPDIADRWALPLLANVKGRERIPNIRPEQSEVSITEDFNFLAKNRTLIKGAIFLKGSSAIGITGASLRASKESIDYSLINWVGDVNQMSQWSFRPYDLSSRIVEDIKFEYEYERRNSRLKTTGGPAHLIHTPTVIPRYMTRTQDRVSDLLITNHPILLRRTTRLKRVQLIGKSNMNCALESPWLSASRRVSQRETDVEVKDILMVKKALIPNAELRMKEFDKLQKKLEDCFSNVALIFKFKP